MDRLKRDMIFALTAVLAIGFSVGFEVGCRTTRTHTDGTIEMTEIDHEALAAFIGLARDVLEYKGAHDSLAEVASIQRDMEAIVVDGRITKEELALLRELYEYTNKVLESEGVVIPEK